LAICYASIMSYDPLTDPASLIAYRLANGEPSLPAKRRVPGAINSAPAGVAAIVGLVLLVVAVSVLVWI
jgi:hypothetical protein